ncbi:TRAP transporter small permease [Oceanobacillus sp. FSL W8-0428]|uniref:C4-dicarboxylate ABC transporter permease n=1 Tax=Oceanobacillus sojae TaxID=582851 RepID=A0A511ZNA5_9BACI|nr:TRAP transporter small permease [Oceanobacillus sojae]GEN88926.1 C4-dicarboxylate ABC transporter permease [Oceanobacillus sojae]
MNKYIKTIDKINSGVKYLVAVLLIILAILVVLQVTTRFIINIPLSWTEELAKYLMIYIVFLGSGLAFRNNQHIAIDFLLEVSSPKTREKLEKLVLWISAIFCLALAYFGIHLTYLVIDQSTPTLQYSMAWAYAAMPIGSLLMFFNIIAAGIDPDKKSVEGDVQ